jgi:hypothetical protein
MATLRPKRHQAFNRALLLMHDFEYAEYPAGSEWVLLTSAQLPSAEPGPTLLPVTAADFSSGNAFVSKSLAEISAFVDANRGALRNIGVSWAQWAVIDQKGLETSTCVVCRYGSGLNEEEEEEDVEEGGWTSQFRACRMPHEEAYGMMANLEIGNMDFEAFVDERAGEQEDGAWRWGSFEPRDRGTNDMTAGEIKREKALQELRDGGYAD